MGVDNGCAGVEAPQGGRGHFGRRSGHVGVPLLGRHAIHRHLDDEWGIRRDAHAAEYRGRATPWRRADPRGRAPRADPRGRARKLTRDAAPPGLTREAAPTS